MNATSKIQTAQPAKEPVDAHVGGRIRLRRHMLGQSQLELADACHVKFQQIQKYETGMNRVSASRLYQIAQAQSVPVSWYFEGLDSAADPDDADVMEAARALAALGAPARQHIIQLARITQMARAIPQP